MPNMNVVFVEPCFPSSQRDFARALAEVGATVIGVGESPGEALDKQLKGWLHHYEQVPAVTDVEAMTGQDRRVEDRVWVEPVQAEDEGADPGTQRARGACGT